MTANPSDYKTIKETAEAWGVTGRWVNMCIADGSIPGAIRVGNMWLVPPNAAKPIAKIRPKKPNINPFEADLAAMITASNAPIVLENPDMLLASMKKERHKSIFEIALGFWRGDFDHAMHCFQRLDWNDAAKLCACPAALASCICAGEYSFFAETETELKNLIHSQPSAAVSAFAEQALATAYTGALAPSMVAEWLKSGDFTDVFAGARPDALYLRAKYFQGLKQYEPMLAVAQTALVFCAAPPQAFFHSEVNLKIACAIALGELHRKAEAERYLLDAMRACLSLGLITPLAINLPLAGGLIETLLHRAFPAHESAVMELAVRTVPGWFTFHNRFTKENITSMLAPRDYQIARLAAQGTPYRVIAERFALSPGALANRMQIIYETLCITGRDRKKELAKYIF